MLNIVVENPFDVHTDKILKWGYRYFVMKKHFLYQLNAYRYGNRSSIIPIFNSDDVKVGDKFRINIPKNELTYHINLPEIDIFGHMDEFRMILNSAQIEIVSPNDQKFSKITINHQFPNIVERIS